MTDETKPDAGNPYHRFAHLIVVDHATQKMTIDGHTFPYYIAEGGPTVKFDGRGNVPIVSFPVLCDRVQIVATTGEISEYTNPWLL